MKKITGCMFCDEVIIKKEELLRNNNCVFLSSKGYNPEGVLEGAGVIIPFAHRLVHLNYQIMRFLTHLAF